MSAITLHLGLDIHKDSITLALAEPGPKGEIRLFGTITNDRHAIEKALGRIRKAHPDAHIEVAYEAGPCASSSSRSLAWSPRPRSSPSSPVPLSKRWLLTECAEHYLLPPKISKVLSARQEGQPQVVRDLSWKAQNRPHLRFARLLGRLV